MLLGKTIVITGISSGIGSRVGELAQALGADIIGVDINDPARPLDAFIKADIGSAQGIAEIIQTLPARIDALCNVAGVSGKIGAAKTLAINFYGLRELTEAVAPRLREGGAVINVASIAGYGWRANLERAKAFVSAPGFPDLAKLLSAHQVPDGEAYPLSKELLLLWTMRAAHEPLFKDRGVRVNAVSPGRWRRPSSRNSGRSSAIRASTTTSRGLAAQAPRRTSRPRCCFCARTPRAGSTAPICQSTEASKPRSTRLFSDFNQRRA
jgi:NAD(P)-dependent dehydrogenase (short-subunit alcohol dehydrogenase family)